MKIIINHSFTNQNIMRAITKVCHMTMLITQIIIVIEQPSNPHINKYKIKKTYLSLTIGKFD